MPLADGLLAAPVLRWMIKSRGRAASQLRHPGRERLSGLLASRPAADLPLATAPPSCSGGGFGCDFPTPVGALRQISLGFGGGAGDASVDGGSLSAIIRARVGAFAISPLRTSLRSSSTAVNVQVTVRWASLMAGMGRTWTASLGGADVPADRRAALALAARARCDRS